MSRRQAGFQTRASVVADLRGQRPRGGPRPGRPPEHARGPRVVGRSSEGAVVAIGEVLPILFELVDLAVQLLQQALLAHGEIRLRVQSTQSPRQSRRGASERQRLANPAPREEGARRREGQALEADLEDGFGLQ